MQVGRQVYEALVDGVHVDILRADRAQVYPHYLGRAAHVEGHARFRYGEIEALGYLEQAAAAGDAERLQRRRYRQADRLLAALRVGHHELRRERVEPALDAFHTGVEALQIDAAIYALSALHT